MSTEPTTAHPLDEFFSALTSRVFQLEYDFITYKSLYTDKETVEILNKTAERFFGMEQSRLGDHIKLSTARLLDPAYSSGNTSRTNLTLYALLDLIKQHISDTAFIIGIETRINDLKQKLEPVIFERMKRLAHLDRATAISGISFSGAEISLAEFGDAIKELADIVDAVDQKVRNTVYVKRIAPTTDAERDVRIMVNRLKATFLMSARELIERQSQYDESKKPSAEKTPSRKALLIRFLHVMFGSARQAND